MASRPERAAGGSGTLRIAMVAGEASGDQLGATLIEALRARHPSLEIRGVAGPRMRAAGCRPLADASELAVMGLVEVLEHLPRLFRLRARLVREIVAWAPDVFIGIDAPGFNLGLAARLRRTGLMTVQYVSPQVWAWRPGRVHRIAESCDLLLCLLPFEPAAYAGTGLRTEFVGHPLADEVVPLPAARAELGLARDAAVLALLPGSRAGEVERLGPAFIEAAQRLRQAFPALAVLAPMANEEVRARFEAQGAVAAGVRLLSGQARLALQAADVALVASGTATLEALLCRCPMVVAYRFGWLTACLLRGLRLVRLRHFALPNLIAGETLVPEFFQEAVRGETLAAALAAQLRDAEGRVRLRARFDEIHARLRRGASDRAAAAVLELLGAGDRGA